MGRVFSVLLWTAVFLLIVLALDQLLVRVPATSPPHVAVATFYRDLRSRVFALVKEPKAAPAAVPAQPASPGSKAPQSAPTSVEAVIGQSEGTPDAASKAPPAEPAPKRPPVKGANPRYVYADNQGALHFADSLAEVPQAYRSKAKVLGE